MKKKFEDKIIHKKGFFFGQDPKKKVPFNFSGGLFTIVLIIFLGAVFYIFIFSEYLKVKKIEITGFSQIEENKIATSVDSVISQNWLKIFPGNNFLLVSKKKVSGKLLDDFRKIKIVEVRKVFPDKISIKIEERQSLIVWCSGGPCYAVDDQGYAYNTIDLDSPDVIQNNLIKIIDANAAPIDVKEKILDEKYVWHIIRLREALEKEKLTIKSEWTTPSIVAEELTVETEKGWKIIFSAKVEPEKAVKNLLIFLKEEMSGQDINRLQYADLRVDNKVYYQLEEDEKSQEEDGSSENNHKDEKEKKDKKD